MKKSSFVFLLLASACEHEAPQSAVVGDAMPTPGPSAKAAVAIVDASKPLGDPVRDGTVTITQTKNGAGTSLGAYFMETTAPGIDCTTGDAEGGCAVKVCTRSFIQSAAKRKLAGDILVMMGQLPATLSPKKDGPTFWYPPQAVTALKDGTSVTFKAAGGADIPAFQGAVTAPAWVTMSKPAIPAAPKNLAIKHGSDLDFAWSPTTKALMNVSLVRAEREKQTTVECAFDASTGKASIAKSMLASLSPGHAVFTIDVVAKSIVKSGDYAVTLAVSDSLLSGGADILPE